MKIKKIIHVFILAVLMFLFMMLTDPGGIPIPFLLIPYLLLAFIFYNLASLGMEIIFRGANGSKIRLYSIVIAAVFINFALLKSINQLTVQDAAISMAIVVVSAVYISKFSLDGERK